MIERRFALVGTPIAHSVSPAMHAAAFTALGLPYEYVAYDIRGERPLGDVLSHLRAGSLAGVNITVPYKRAILARVDEIAPSAAEVGAANVLCRDAKGRIVAHNTDAQALTEELDELTRGAPRLRAVIVGAGGAGLAAIVACQRVGFNVVGITTRSWVSSEAMFSSTSGRRARALRALTTVWPKALADSEVTSGGITQALRIQWRELAANADCVIQATPAGMLGAEPGHEIAGMVIWEGLPAHALAYDVVYNPRVTPFLQKARARGLRAVDGLGMLVRQAAASFELWTGQPAPLDVMRFAAENALGSAGAGPRSPERGGTAG